MGMVMGIKLVMLLSAMAVVTFDVSAFGPNMAGASAPFGFADTETLEGGKRRPLSFWAVVSYLFAGGPLLPPGKPFTPDTSCCCTDGFWAADPVVAPAGGPFLLPGAPAIPVPEFCALGLVAALPEFVPPGICAAEPDFSCSPTKPDPPEFWVLIPLSASCWIAF
jgi:hypothetical protein